MVGLGLLTVILTVFPGLTLCSSDAYLLKSAYCLSASPSRILLAMSFAFHALATVMPTEKFCLKSGMMSVILTLCDVCIFFTTALATHLELADLLSKTLAHVCLSNIVFIAKVCLWPTFEQSIKNPHLALHSTLTL